jgi:TRAP-type C4-dicarboxylate transport system substrate-binding protein
MRKGLSATLVAATFALGSTGAAMAQDYPSLNLKLAHFGPSNFTGSKIDKWFADEVRKRSGGKVRIQIFWSESLGKANEVLDLVASGAVDLGATSPGYFPNQLPLTGATNSVMMQFNSNEAATRATAELVEKFPAVRKELERAKVYPIFFHSLNTYRPFCTKPIEKIEDFAGLKVRSWGEYIPIMWQALGATPVSLMTPDMYESLQRGTVDCAFWPHELNYTMKLNEVAKYTWAGDVNHFGAIPTWPLWVNWQTWHEKWPDSVRKLLTEVGLEAMERDIKAVQEDEKKALDVMVEKSGVKVVDFKDMDKVRAKIPDLADAWIEKMKARGLGAEAQEIADYWRKRSAELN